MTTPLLVELAWGVPGGRTLAAECDVVVVIDVLSFTTAVSVAVSCGASVRPVEADHEPASLADGDLLAGPRDGSGPTLSPLSLRELRPGQRLVLPSPNGAAIAAALGDTTAVAAALRNTSAVAGWLREHGGRVGIVAAGERDEDRWRPSYEDAVGAGAVASQLQGRWSPQVSAAAVAFAEAEAQLRDRLLGCRSGAALVARGFADDVAAAADLDADSAVPLWRGGVFLAAP